VKNLITNAQAGFDSLSDVDKEALQVAARLLGQSLLFSLTKVTIVHVMGRKIAPNVFKNWGRTFAVVSLIEAATGRYKVSEEDKKTVANIKERQAEQKLAEIRKFGA
jgi:hypothetical protein